MMNIINSVSSREDYKLICAVQYKPIYLYVVWNVVFVC